MVVTQRLTTCHRSSISRVVLSDGVSLVVVGRSTDRFRQALWSSVALVTVIASGALAGAAAAKSRTFASAQSTPIAISPAPGTPDASPDTQISILGAAPGQIQSVRVSGTSSGFVRGAFHAYSGRRGASYVLSRPLTQGERVSVTVRIAGRKPIATQFTVAHLAATPPILDLPVTQPSKLDHFVSEPQLLPPRIEVNQGSIGADIFLTPLPAPEIHPGSNNAITVHPVGPGGPMIIDGRGRLVWFKQLPAPVVAANLRLGRWGRREVLTWWQGKVTIAAYGIGEGVIADTSYRTIRTVHAGNGYSADIHEFRLTPSGEALFTVNSLVMVHLPGSAPGALSPLLDSIVQEVDVRTGLVVWEWHGLGHIPLKDSYATPATSAYFDAFHVNAIQPLSGNRLLVSARDTSAVYEINRASGHIVWTLGGRASSFAMATGARFWFQHDATLLPGNRVSLFDDEAGPPIFGPYSRGLVLGLDMRRHTARVLGQYHRPGHNTPAQSEGSVQILPNANVFVGFGATPFFSEFSAGGSLLFDASLPKDDGSYRAFSFPWKATPRTHPAIAVKTTSAGHVAVYASWNGASTVARWQVLAGGKPVASAPDRNFETRIAVASNARGFEVRALNPAGKVLARSSEVHPS